MTLDIAGGRLVMRSVAPIVDASFVLRGVVVLSVPLDADFADGIKGESPQSKAEQEYWIRATVVEALQGLGKVTESEAAFAAAKDMKPAPEVWMIDSTEEQLGKLKALLTSSAARV